VVTKEGFFGTAIICFLLVVLGICGITIFSTRAFADNVVGVFEPPVQSPGADTTTVADTLHTANIETQPAGTSTLLTDIAIMIISLI
jgi:hypothetical protein